MTAPIPDASLNALSPLDGRYADKCAALRSVFSEAALIRYRIRVEALWFRHLAIAARLPELADLPAAVLDRLQQLAEGVDSAASAVKAIERRTNHDVKAVEYWVRERLHEAGATTAHLEFVHFACTSEDINNLAYALMLADARRQVLLPDLDGVTALLRTLAVRHAAEPMLSRTHGQAASPTTLGKELAVFVRRIERQRQQFAAIGIAGKMNGAVGNYNAHLVAYPDIDWQGTTREFVTALGLDWNPYTIQIEPHDWIAEYCDALARTATVLIDFCRDTWGYISIGYFRQRAVAGEVGSSTMPHKINPIDFENAEGNLGLSVAMLRHFAEKLPISRWQRDLTDSTVLRNLGVALGHVALALKSVDKGLSRLEPDPARMAADLDANWEVLGEAVQTVMRRHGIADAYEQLKALTRGQRITPESLHEFIQGLAIPAATRARLMTLTPAGYIGLAAELARGA